MQVMYNLASENLCYQLQCVKGSPGAIYFLSQIHELWAQSKMQSVLGGNNSEFAWKHTPDPSWNTNEGKPF